jgi:hypothetical protein
MRLIISKFKSECSNEIHDIYWIQINVSDPSPNEMDIIQIQKWYVRPKFKRDVGKFKGKTFKTIKWNEVPI